jgi:hypothetical protein
MYSTALSTGAHLTSATTLPLTGQARARGGDLTAVDGIGILIGDLDAELLLYRHDNLDRVQAVQAEVVGEVSSGLDLLSSEMSAWFLQEVRAHPLCPSLCAN